MTAGMAQGEAGDAVDASVGASVIAPRRPVTRATLRWFWVLVFVIGWGTGAAMVVLQEQIEAVFGEIGYTNPVFILIVWSPALAAIYLVWHRYGGAGLRSYLRRLTMWRMPAAWWAFLLLGVPAVKYVSAAINGTIDEFPYSPWYGVLPTFASAAVIGPVEELGWRGFALPLLQRRYTPFRATVILGVVWAFWHIPAFLMTGTQQSAWSFGPFVIGVLALAIILTPMFNAARGSILVAALFHLQMNNPAWPDAQPWENYLFAAVAVAIVVLTRKSMLRRDGAATDVLTIGEEVIPDRAGRWPAERGFPAAGPEPEWPRSSPGRRPVAASP